MSTVKNLMGQTFSRLTVQERAGSTSYGKALWKCKCECGNFVTATTGSLISGNTKSCGCYFVERVTKHGGSRKGSYHTWRGMMRRCYKEKDKDFKNYGGRGIKVCDRWHNYADFAEDMGEPTGAQTLDRIDNNGDYTPENCRWAEIVAQSRNKRISRKNTSGAKGVSEVKLKYGAPKWIAHISVNYKKYYSKVCNTLDEAAMERKRLEEIYWG